jgi:hypothetical protein
MTPENMLCLLVGSALSGIICLSLVVFIQRKDKRERKRLKAESYRRGWRDGRDAQFLPPTFSSNPKGLNAGSAIYRDLSRKERRTGSPF